MFCRQLTQSYTVVKTMVIDKGPFISIILQFIELLILKHRKKVDNIFHLNLKL